MCARGVRLRIRWRRAPDRFCLAFGVLGRVPDNPSPNCRKKRPAVKCPGSPAQQMFDHHLVERLVVTIRDELPGAFLVEGARLFDQSEERAAAVVQVRDPVLHLGRAEGMHVEADEFPVLAIAVSLEGADLVERNPQIVAAKRLVLIKLQPVLIVQVERPEFAEGHRKINFIGRIKSREDRVGAFDEAADAFRVARELGDGQRVADGGQIRVVHWLVRLGLDGQTHLVVVREHRVECLDQQIDAAPAVLGFADIRAFAREPTRMSVPRTLAMSIERSDRSREYRRCFGSLLV